jgi:HlyD family secretion protein
MAQQIERSYRGWIVTIVAVLACVAIVVYYRSQHSVVVIHAARVARQDIKSTVSTNGKVEPTEDFQAHAPFAGVVQDLYVEQGERVTAGQQLVRMDDSGPRKDVAAAQAALQSAEDTLQAMQRGGTQDERLGASNDMTAAESQRRQAEASLASLQKLQSQGAASANEVASAQQRVTDAQAKVKQLQTRSTSRYSSEDIKTQQAQVAQARASLAAAQASLNNVVKRAPFAGTVYSVPVSQYDFVQMGDTLLDVADLTHLQIRAYFDEPEIGNLSVGQPVKIVWDAKPLLVWHGHILQAPTTIIQYGATRNVGECLITVDDAKGDLLPNTNVTVTVTTRQQSNVLSLPREALQTDGPNNFVYKVVNETLVKTPVTPGVVNLTQVEIVKGLQEGDQVALGSVTEADLRNGLRVKVKP